MKNIFTTARFVLPGILLIGLTLCPVSLFTQEKESQKKQSGYQQSQAEQPDSKEQEQQQATIVENVSVSTVQTPVRVFRKKQPVDGLTKSDFRLYVNGQEREINDFYQVRKKLKLNDTATVPGESQTPPEPRTCVLIFNLADYHQDLNFIMDYFFKHIARPGDKLIAITNRHFFPEWEIKSVDATKAEIMKIINKEISTMRADISRFQMELRSLAYSFKSDIIDAQTPQAAGTPLEPIFKTFFLSYQFILDDMKSKFLSLPLEEYVRISHYLKNQQGEKYVFNFYQIGRLPLPDSFGELQQMIDQYAEIIAGPTSQAGNLARMVRDFQYRLREKVHDVEDLLVRDISNSFLSSGATFHTMLLHPVQPPFSRDFKYTPVASETETILKRISRLTGGSVTSSNKIAKFAKKIIAKEDIIYMLSYNTRPSDPKHPKLKVKLADNSKYRLVYDNKKRIKSFRSAKKKIDEKKPDLEIAKLTYEDSKLKVRLNNINIVSHEGQSFGMVRAHIKVYGQDNKPVASIKKTFRGFRKSGEFRTSLPQLDKGNYDVILEVKDVFSLDSRSVGDAIRIRRQ